MDYRELLLLSYPRSGSTLTRTYFSLLQGRPQFSLYEGDIVIPNGGPLTNALGGLNLIKSHHYKPAYRDIVYLVRDGRNAMISHLYLQYLSRGHTYSSLDEIHAAIRYLSDEGHFWGDHVGEILAQPAEHRIHFVRFEDLISQPFETLKGIIAFMGREVPDEALRACISHAGSAKTYFAAPLSGYTYTPEAGSIYEQLQKYRKDNYWVHIFDDRTRRYFHERGGTPYLIRFGYEQSEQWWACERT